MGLNVGDVVDGKYRIVRLLGEGGMGAVYEGENTRIHRRVAIKVLHSGVAQTADAVQRFEREAQAAGRIGNEHIVEVLDMGNLPDGDRYMVMEFLDGESLADRIKNRGRLSAQELLPIAVQMLEGLKAAHQVGIIHRDLKPDNVFLIKVRGGQTDFVKLVDFGISKFNVMGGEFSMTRTGAVMGTPYYMSPEQAKGTRDIDHRVDLYAAGVILYEAITGQVPFDAETFNELLFKIVLEDAPPVQKAQPDLDPSFAAIVDKSRAKEAAQRFQSAGEFQEALRSWAQGAQLSFSPAVVAAPVGAATPTNLSTGTANAWANTGENALPPPKSRSGMMVGMAAAFIILGGGGAFLALKIVGSGDEATALAAAAQQEAARAQADQEGERRLAEERAKAEAAKSEAEKARAEADKAKTEAASKAQSELSAEKSAEAARVATRTPAPTVAPKRSVAPAPATKTTTKSTSAPATTTGAHRKIRVDL